MPGGQPLLNSRIERILKDCRDSKDVEDETSRETAPLALAFLRNVNPIAQNGPQCGLVALSMAADMLSPPRTRLSVESILDEAKRIGVTSNGEIFSVSWLASLASILYSRCKPTVIDVAQLSNRSRFVVETLFDQKCLLVPYDTDKNHEPCLNNGHTAHWALVVGFLIVDFRLSLSPLIDFEKTSRAACPCLDLDDGAFGRLYWLNPVSDSFCHAHKSAFSAVSSTLVDECIYVFALHGKSKHVAVWPLDKLLASNENLHEIGEKRLNDGLEYRIPEDGVEGELRGKMLVLE